MLFNRAGNFGSWLNPVALTQSELPYYFEEYEMFQQGMYGKHHTEETKHKMHKARIEGINSGKIKHPRGMLGKRHSEEICRKISIAHKGKKVSEETKNKLRIALKNRKLSEEHKRKISIIHKGKKHSEETKRKMSEAHKGRMFSKETCRKISLALKKGYASGVIKINYNKKSKDTSIEILIENELKKNNFNYEKQKHIKDVGIVDFFLPEYNIIIECDGDYWHNRPEAKKKDIQRDFISMFLYQYKTIRFWENEINNSLEKCIKIIKKEIR